MVKIRMKRMGTKKRPFYRIVVADARSPRDGRFIEQVGVYQPLMKAEDQLKFDGDKIKEWHKKGAQPTALVRRLLNQQKFYFER